MNTHKRNWPEYNEWLVIEGEAVMALDILDHWDDEVERMNKGKKKVDLFNILKVLFYSWELYIYSSIFLIDRWRDSAGNWQNTYLR